MKLKRTLLWTIAVALGVSVAGIASAWYSLTACEDFVFEVTQRENVIGTDFNFDEVRLSRSDMSARIAGPFLVEAGYSLPQGLHGSIHTTRFAVFFGHVWQISSDDIHLVDTDRVGRVHNVC
jgi:hypothetical protein